MGMRKQMTFFAGVLTGGLTILFLYDIIGDAPKNRMAVFCLMFGFIFWLIF